MSDSATSGASFQITLQPSGRRFSCGAGETLLDGAFRAGINLPHQCKTGTCGSCKAGWLDGDSQACGAPGATEPGSLLLCCHTPRSDMTLRCTELADGQAVRKVPVRVQQVERLADDVMRLVLQPPEGQQVKFKPGQYMDVLLARGARRSYSLASVAGDGSTLELHVRKRAGGLFTEHVFERLKARDVLRLEGPYGGFKSTGGAESPSTPLLLLATGTGFAPVKSIVEHAIAAGHTRPMVIYWGGRTPADLYLHSTCERWATELPWLRYEPVLSRASTADGWHGRTGYIQDAALQDHPSLATHEVYACGSPSMVEDARRAFVERAALPADAFFADAFHSAVV